MKNKSYTGSCVCGGVRYAVLASANEIYFCHCTVCRKNYGLYGAFIAAPNELFKLKNEKNIRWYASSKDVRRGFCKTCGSPILWKKKDSTHTFFLPGLIDGTIGKKKPKHIFVEDRGDYYQIPSKKSSK